MKKLLLTTALAAFLISSCRRCECGQHELPQACECEPVVPPPPCDNTCTCPPPQPPICPPDCTDDCCYENGGGDEPPIERRNAVIEFGIFDVFAPEAPGSTLYRFRRSVQDSLAVPGVDTVFMQLEYGQPFITRQNSFADMAYTSISGIRSIDSNRIFGRDHLLFSSIYEDTKDNFNRMGFQANGLIVQTR